MGCMDLQELQSAHKKWMKHHCALMSLKDKVIGRKVLPPVFSYLAWYELRVND